MRGNSRPTSTLPPLLLRLCLGIVFLWAGASKLLHKDPFTGERAARLANMGLIAPPPPESPIIPVVPEREPTPRPPTDPRPEPPAEPARPPAATPPTPATDPNLPDPAPEQTGATQMRLILARASVPSAPQTSGAVISKIYTAADFEKPVHLRRLYNLVLLMNSAAQPNEHGHTLWPRFAARPSTLRALAWAATLTEFIGGILILLGLLTRLAAVGLFGVMLTAMWLTQIGPNLGAPGSLLGFLPDPMLSDPARWNDTRSGWLTLLWQFTLACVALALAISGAGRASMDALIFRRHEPANRKVVRIVNPPARRPV